VAPTAGTGKTAAPSTSSRCACRYLRSTSGSRPSGCEDWSSCPATAWDSGSSAAITTRRTPGRSSVTGSSQQLGGGVAGKRAAEDSSTAPLITLTTDFGTGSPYVAAMKARLLAGCPQASLVDISHSVGAFDIHAGAFVLWAGTRDFPPGSVHLAV